jgi:hypothetical protein
LHGGTADLVVALIAMGGPAKQIGPAMLLVLQVVFLLHILLFGLLYLHVTQRTYRRWRRVQPADPMVRARTVAGSGDDDGGGDDDDDNDDRDDDDDDDDTPLWRPGGYEADEVIGMVMVVPERVVSVVGCCSLLWRW